jgi:hypothetical protein
VRGLRQPDRGQARRRALLQERLPTSRVPIENGDIFMSTTIEPNETGGARDLRARLANPDAFLSRTDLRALGLGRRAVDAVFRACPNVELPGYSYPLIRVPDYVALIERSTYHGDRVRPCGRFRSG